MTCKCNEYRNMLEDVVNELDLSEIAIEKHGPLGTPPAELVKLVLEEKDRIIMALKNGFKVISDGLNLSDIIRKNQVRAGEQTVCENLKRFGL